MNGFVKKTLIFIVAMTIVGLGGWFGRKAYKHATERRRLTEASQFLAKNDLRNASLCLQRTMQINPMSALGSKLMADMLESAGAPSALSWRIRAFQLQTNNIEYRFAWAETALKMQDPQSAAQALSGVNTNSRSTATFCKLAGALAWDIHDAPDAEREYGEALRLEPTNEATVLNLATIRLNSTNKTVADAARLSLEKIPADSPVHLTALRYLAADAAGHGRFEKAVEYSREIVGNAKANYSDKIAHLELLRDAKSQDYESWRNGLEKDAKQSPEHAWGLAHWMLLKEGPATGLHWIQSLPPSIQTNTPVQILVSDCEISLKDWKGLLANVQKENWGDAEYYRLSIESLADRHLGENSSAKIAWDRALRMSSHRLDRLTRLAQSTASLGWNAELNQTLREVVSEFPSEKWATDELMKTLYANGDTAGLAEILTKVYSANPADNNLKNNLANVSLLRKSDLENAYRLCKEAYASSPENPFFISTYGYSLLLQNKPDEAVKVMDGLKADYLRNPSIAAYYGVVEAQTGHKDAAREPLKLAESARLLPEEKEMVRQAIARL